MDRETVGCPVELALALLGGKWKTVLLARLKERPHRYAELRSVLPSLSDKVLTARLRELVVAGLVVQTKRGRRGAPSRYELSARGQTLRPALEALFAVGLAEGRARGVTFTHLVDDPADTNDHAGPPERSAGS